MLVDTLHQASPEGSVLHHRYLLHHIQCPQDPRSHHIQCPQGLGLQWIRRLSVKQDCSVSQVPSLPVCPYHCAAVETHGLAVTSDLPTGP